MLMVIIRFDGIAWRDSNPDGGVWGTQESSQFSNNVVARVGSLFCCYILLQKKREGEGRAEWGWRESVGVRVFDLETVWFL